MNDNFTSNGNEMEMKRFFGVKCAETEKMTATHQRLVFLVMVVWDGADIGGFLWVLGSLIKCSAQHNW